MSFPIIAIVVSALVAFVSQQRAVYRADRGDVRGAVVPAMHAVIATIIAFASASIWLYERAADRQLASLEAISKLLEENSALLEALR